LSEGDYENLTPIALTVDGEVTGGFRVTLTAQIDGSDQKAIDARLDVMRRSWIRQDAFMHYTLALEDLRQHKFAMANISATIDAKRRERAVLRAELIAGFNDKWVANNRLGEFKLNGNERSNIENFDKETETKLAELEEARDRGLPLKIKNSEEKVRDYRDLVEGRDKHEVIERRFIESNLRPHELPDAAE
jgi:hypothetical protein